MGAFARLSRAFFRWVALPPGLSSEGKITRFKSPLPVRFEMAERIAPGEIQQYRAYLYRYALLQVRDANRAEDVVQETLLGAIEGLSLIHI